MKSIIRLSVAWALVTFGTGCAFMFAKPQHPLAASEVSKLTVCSHGDLDKVRKSLMLAGYSIRSSTTDSIETEFKQTDGYGGHKTSERINVVRIDGNTIKFNVRTRSDSLDKVETGRVTAANGRVVATDHQLVQNSNESDMNYLQETRVQHEATQKAVCGG